LLSIDQYLETEISQFLQHDERREQGRLDEAVWDKTLLLQPLLLPYKEHHLIETTERFHVEPHSAKEDSYSH
jgi:hypothetical protein